jgi:hypothetical protein
MKIYINKYRDHWISPYTIVNYMFFWTDWSKCGRRKGFVPDAEFVDNPAWVDKAVNYLAPISQGIQWALDRVHPRIEYVKIEPWDTWSMDNTLSLIILPMLKQLKKDKHGAPFVDDADVPDYLKSTSAPPKENPWDTDDNHFKRWDWILDEMIWTFEQKVADDAEDQFYDHTESRQEPDLEKSVKALKVDQQGLDACNLRKKNGFKLFGKYYEALWD